ncbi:MAG: hypothetical protein V1779_04125 [bacterium]
MFIRILTIVVTFIVTISQVLSQDVEEIIKKTLEARGDVATYKGLTSLIMSGTQFQMGMNIPFKLYVKKINEKKSKYEFESEAMGSKQQLGYNGDTMWVYAGPEIQIVPDEYVEQYLPQISQIKDFAETPLMKYKEKGHTLELSGSVNEDGRDAYTLKLIQNEERESYLYIDKNNFELFKIFATMPGQDGEDIEIEMNYSDYKAVNGFKLPYKMVLKMGELGTIEMMLDKVEFNPVIDDSIFQVPKEQK